MTLTTLGDVLKQVEDLLTYPRYNPHSDIITSGVVSTETIAYAVGATAALEAVASYLRSRIEHDRGRG
jgi:hypothetical protein